MNSNLCGVILAAGMSSRMGELKALLPIEGTPAILHLIRSFQKANVSDIYVVTGYKDKEISEEIAGEVIIKIYNPNYEQGMFSSCLAALTVIHKKQYDGFFFCPVDCPVLKPQTLLSMAQVFEKQEKRLIYPVFKGKKGHPPLIGAAYIESILAYRGDGGLKGALKEQDKDACFLPLDDWGVLVDMDTKADYQALQAKLKGAVTR